MLKKVGNNVRSVKARSGGTLIVGGHLELLGQARGLSVRVACSRSSAVFVLVGWGGQMLCQVSSHLDGCIFKDWAGKVSLKFIFKGETVSFGDRLNMRTLKGRRSFLQNHGVFWSNYFFEIVVVGKIRPILVLGLCLIARDRKPKILMT